MKQILDKFSEYLDIKYLKKNYELTQYNNDIIASGTIKDFHHQEKEAGFAGTLERVGNGSASRNSKVWSAVFRFYNVLQYVKKSGQNVLDLGCDIGYLRKLIHNGTYFSDTNYVGIELRPNRVKQASNLLPKCNNPAIYVVHDLFDMLPFVQSESVNVLYCMEIFEHLDEDHGKLFIRELHRVLADDGTLILSMPNYDESLWYVPRKDREHGQEYHLKQYKLDEFKKLAKKNKFQITDYHGWLNDRRKFTPEMNDEEKRIFLRLVKIMGSGIATQIMGQLFPEKSGCIIYEMKKV
jgi:SAM-dependent methyltransferase